jgi:histone H3/H4
VLLVSLGLSTPFPKLYWDACHNDVSGVKRIALDAYPRASAALTDFLVPIIHASAILAEHGRRHTVTVNDVLRALRKEGR